MKNKNFIYGLLITAAMLMLTSCVTKTDDGYTCVKTPTGCGTVNSCSDGTQSYYDNDGTKYYCDGTDCTDAANEAIEDMCGKSAEESLAISKEQLLESADRLLE